MRRNKQHKRRGGGSRRGGKNFALRAIHSVPFSIPSFYLEQATSGNGGFTTAVSAATLTAANSFPVDPYNVGGNIYNMASLYTHWRLRKCRITYVPFVSASGVIPNVSGATTSPNYGDRAFSLAFIEDGSLTGSSFTSMLLSGGKVFNTSRKQSLSLTGGLASSQWYYSSTTAGSPSAIDKRLACPGTLNMAFSDTSTTATLRYGVFIISGICDYQGLLDRTVPIGISLKDDEKQQQAQQQRPLQLTQHNTIPQLQSQQNKGWF
jgi:hypothetical protein